MLCDSPNFWGQDAAVPSCKENLMAFTLGKIRAQVWSWFLQLNKECLLMESGVAFIFLDPTLRQNKYFWFSLISLCEQHKEGMMEDTSGKGAN